jgi:putative GTP pyrophosphokinase
MENWIKPEYTRSRVDRAGENIRNGSESHEDLVVLDNWRASHAYILNTFQANLRSRSKDKKIIVAQRLKRGPTILDKLRRQNSMSLSRMHDIAGCRVIFQNISELSQFRKSFHNSRFRHELLSGERYKYIDNPKDTGYRGIHDVYKYNVSSKTGVLWNGLRIELQYRTIFQHAWATAVEVTDIITTNRIKFDQTDARHKLFFQLASEIIARAFESLKSCFPKLLDSELVSQFNQTEETIRLLQTFSNLKLVQRERFSSKITLLIFYLNEDINKQYLEIESFGNIKKAILRYSELEHKLSGRADIVLVKGDDEKSIRDAFRNYFQDTHDFVNYINEGCTKLLK